MRQGEPRVGLKPGRPPGNSRAFCLVCLSTSCVHVGPLQPAAYLTRRQVQLICEVAAGHQNKIIAARTGLAEGTVRASISAIYRRLNLNAGNTRVALANFAHEHGIAGGEGMMEMPDHVGSAVEARA